MHRTFIRACQQGDEKDVSTGFPGKPNVVPFPLLPLPGKFLIAAIDFVSVGRRRNELTYNLLSMIDAGAFVHYLGPTLLSFGLTLSKTSVLSSLT